MFNVNPLAQTQRASLSNLKQQYFFRNNLLVLDFKQLTLKILVVTETDS